MHKRIAGLTAGLILAGATLSAVGTAGTVTARKAYKAPSTTAAAAATYVAPQRKCC